MANTEVNISLISKSNSTVNITALSGSIDGSAETSPVINFITTGAQGPTGVQGTPGEASITSNSITSLHLAEDSVGSSEIIDGSVGYDELGVASVRGNRIMPIAITTGKIADDAVTQSKLADNSVGVAQIISGTITSELLEDLTILGDKLGDLTITAGKIQDLAITTQKVRDRNITGAKIESNADLDGEVKAHNLKLKGSSPATLTGPDSDALQIKSNTTLDFKSTSDSTIALM